MLTSERLLKIISILTVLVTVVFSAVVVITEVMKPDRMFDKIIENQCGGSITESKADNEDDLNTDKESCILIKETGNDFLKLASSLGRLENHQYLYTGKEGVIIKNGENDFSKEAEFIHRCLRKSECALEKLEDSEVSVTGLLYDRSGELVCSNTFSKTALSQTAKGFRRLFTEMTKIQKKDLSELALKLFFHHRYTFIEKKDPKYINKLLNNDTDGLFLSSRGAKIRVLPFEYSKNAMKILDRKARQYGLKKDEYKNELAKIYLFRTSQYFENKQKLVPWEGTSSFLKKDYSDNIASMFLKKHLEKVLDSKKQFALEYNIADGKKESKNASVFTRISLAQVMIEHSPIALKIIKGLVKRKLSVLSSSYLFNVIKLNENDLNIDGDFIKQSADTFSDPEEVKEFIKKDPVYSGLFLESHLLSTGNASSTQALFKTATSEFTNLDKKDKIRFIIYLGKLRPEKDSILYKDISAFINDKTELIYSTVFNNRGFYATAGSISLENSDKPDTALTIALASGLSELRSQGLLDIKLAQIESAAGNFIKFMMVTGDDFPRWNDPRTKAKIQGGIRSHVGSEKIKLSNSIRAFNYFSNRLNSQRKK